MAQKSPHYVRQLFLAVILCVLGGLAYWFEYSKKPKDLERAADEKKILALKTNSISKLEIRGPSTKPENSGKLPLSVALECASLAEKLCRTEDTSKWEMIEPLRTKADDATVNSLLKNIGNFSASEIVNLKTETQEKRATLLRDYGLDSAARANPLTRRIAITIASGAKMTAYFGVKHPISDGVFSVVEKNDKVDEETVYVVPDWQIAVFDQKTSYFRDKRLFGMNEKEISGFTLTTAKKIMGKLEGNRTPDEKGWILKSAGSEVEGDLDTIEGILSGVSYLAAKDFVAERKDSPEAKRALAGAKVTYDLTLKTKSRPKHLRLYEKKSPKQTVATVYAAVADQDPLFEIDVYAAEKIEKTFDEMRVGKLISLTERYGITAIDVVREGATPFRQRLVKETGGRWTLDGKETARGKVEAILDRLSTKSVIKYYGPVKAEDALKLIFLKSVDGKDETVSEIEFWVREKRLYSKNTRAPKKEIVELATDLIPELPWEADSLIEKGAP